MDHQYERMFTAISGGDPTQVEAFKRLDWFEFYMRLSIMEQLAEERKEGTKKETPEERQQRRLKPQTDG